MDEIRTRELTVERIREAMERINQYLYQYGHPGAMTQHEGTALPEDTVDTLCDFARRGQEGEFKDLARMVGVEADKLDELWAGTVRRVKR